MKTLIAFTGLAHCGKSTIAAKALVDYHGFKRLSFAEPIRAMLRGLGLTEEELTIKKDEPSAKLGGKTPRYAMQTLGTEWGRGIMGQRFWVMIAERLIHEANSPVVFDDCRFENEANAIHALRGYVVKIVRPDLKRISNHSSEDGLPKYSIDAVIMNDTTPAMLELAVLRYVAE